MEDADVVQRVRGGDTQAYGRLVERHQAGLLAFCCRLTGTRADGEDLAHDAFVEAYLKLGQLRDPARYASWLRAIALNLCRMRHRAGRTRPTCPLPPDLMADGPPASGPAGAVLRGLSRLSAAHRMALVLRAVEGLSYDEMAAFLQVPVGTVMSRLHRARRELRRACNEDEDEETVMTPDEDFGREIEAEIDSLLRLFRDDPSAMARLRIVLDRAPDRFVELIRRADGDEALADLARLLRRLGRPAVDVALACRLGTDPSLRARAGRLLVLAAATARPARGEQPGRRAAAPVIYHVIEAVLTSGADPQARATLLADLMDASDDERTELLFLNALLCDPGAAMRTLLDRFWRAERPADVYRGTRAVHALCRMGTRFGRELLGPLAGAPSGRQAVALEGAEALARSLACHWWDPGTADHADYARESRFRLKWVPPMPRDRDDAVIADVEDRLAPLLGADDSPARQAALRALGLLRSARHRARIRECAEHPDPATRAAALRALAEAGGEEETAWFLRGCGDVEPVVRRAAAEALGRFPSAEAEETLVRLLADRDAEVRRAAAAALGDLKTEGAAAALRPLTGSPDRALARIAANALHARRPRPSGPAGEHAGTAAARVRGGALPAVYLSIEAALRALPADRAYGETAITRAIAAACIDYSSARRYLVDEGLLERERGAYRLTDYGRTAWRVERLLAERYLGGPSA